MSVNARIIYIFKRLTKNTLILNLIQMVLMYFSTRRILNFYLRTNLFRRSTWRTINFWIFTWLNKFLLLRYTRVKNLTLYLKKLLLSLFLIIWWFYTYHWRFIWLFSYWLDYWGIHVIVRLFYLLFLDLCVVYLDLLCLYWQFG